MWAGQRGRTWFGSDKQLQEPWVSTCSSVAGCSPQGMQWKPETRIRLGTYKCMTAGAIHRWTWWHWPCHHGRCHHGHVTWQKAGSGSVHKQQCVAGKEGREEGRLAGYTFTCGCSLLLYHSVTKSCLTICKPMDCGPPNFSVHEISWARILGWFAVSFFRKSFPPRDQTCVSCVGKQILYTEPPGKPAADYFYLIYPRV